jgi:hypothetical protein
MDRLKFTTAENKLRTMYCFTSAGEISAENTHI